MKVILFGGSGLVGSALQKEWSKKFDLIVATRDKSKSLGKKFFWDPVTGELPSEVLEGVDVIVNLAGENIASGRWNEEKKKRILDSRVLSTALIAKKIEETANRPKLWIQASAIGYYGNHGDEELDEETKRGPGFLASVCRQWEEAASLAAKYTRLIYSRFGMVLSEEGGALSKMIPPFKLGLGGKIGPGTQWMSWIDVKEIPLIFEHFISHTEISGPVNVVTDAPVTNATFTKTLGHILGRPTFFPMPATAAKGMLGELAEELILSSTKVNPKVLLESGYQFRYSPLEKSLKGMLK